MTLELYQRVVLREDLPEAGLKRGDVAMLIDTAPHPAGGEDGYVLEVFNALGESISVVTVKQSHVEALQADEVLSVRRFAKAG